MNIRLSEIDRQRFDTVIAKLDDFQKEEMGNVAAWCYQNQVKMLIIRCPSDQLDLVRQFEDDGAQLMDVLVYYRKRNVKSVPVDIPDRFAVRTATSSDAPELERLALRAFSGFVGHYHADLRLPRSECDMVYGSWAANSCLSTDVADEVLLVTYEEIIIGFLTLKSRDNNAVEILLNAVDPEHQGLGVYSLLIKLALNWTVERGIDDLIVSTQLTNLAPQKVWCRHGFEPESSFCTLHKWY